MKPPLSPIRVRFAPSPTGYLHVGGARTALFNYLYAQTMKSQGKEALFVLRIEDTDQQRSTQEATDQVLNSLKWLGINWDEGPNVGGVASSYYQSQRLGTYQKYFDKLLAEKKAYYCFCSDKEIELKKKQLEATGHPYVYDEKCRHLTEAEIKEKKITHPNYTYRFKVEPQEVYFDDHTRGTVKFDTKLIGDFIIRKSDGYPTYNFAVVVDDALMKINVIIRGDDHISNTPRQILIYKGLDFPLPEYSHVSLILGNNRQKLSKRHGATSVLEFREQGYYTDPFLNHLALLGWSPNDVEEVIDRAKLEKSFTSLQFNGAPAVFDYQRLNYLNGLYIRNLPEETLIKDCREYLKKYCDSYSSFKSLPQLDTIIISVKEYCKKLADFSTHIKEFLQEEIKINDSLLEIISTPQSEKLFQLAGEILRQKQTDFIEISEWNQLKEKAKERDIKGKSFFLPMRIKLTGKDHGIEMDTFFKLVRRDVILKRLNFIDWDKKK